MVIPDTELIR